MPCEARTKVLFFSFIRYSSSEGAGMVLTTLQIRQLSYNDVVEHRNYDPVGGCIAYTNGERQRDELVRTSRTRSYRGSQRKMQ